MDAHMRWLAAQRSRCAPLTGLSPSSEPAAGVEQASWVIRSPKTPLFVGVFQNRRGLSRILCNETDSVASCDYAAAAGLAVPGTVCIGRLCTGSVALPAPDLQHYLLISYPK